MNLGGLDVRAVAGMFRDVRARSESMRPLVVDGVLARELARILAAGGDPSAVQVGGDPRRAEADIVVLAGCRPRSRTESLRRAARALVPVLAVQTAPGETSEVPYVPATEVIVCAPGQGFPLSEIAHTLARVLDEHAVGLASRLPALRPAVVERFVQHRSRSAGLAALLAARKRELFPVLVLQQLRLALDIAAANGRALGRERAPELAVGVVAGFAVRETVRRLGGRRRAVVAALSGYAVTARDGRGGPATDDARRGGRPLAVCGGLRMEIASVLVDEAHERLQWDVPVPLVPQPLPEVDAVVVASSLLGRRDVALAGQLAEDSVPRAR